MTQGDIELNFAQFNFSKAYPLLVLTTRIFENLNLTK